MGRIGQEMAARLCAMGTFVIVCARSEEQMRMAHAAGAHPVPLSRLAAACRQADVIVNTIPAHVLGADALEAIGGIRPSLSWQARRMAWICRKPFVGACRSAWRAVCRGGMRPMDAGGALFDALARGMAEIEEGEEKADE